MITEIPPFVNEDCLQRLFEACGKIEKVFTCSNSDELVYNEASKYYRNTPVAKGYMVGYVVFESSKGVAAAGKIKKPLIFSCNEYPLVTGINKIVNDYNESFVDKDLLQQEVNEYLNQHDIHINQEEDRLKVTADQPDDEGWVTITKYSRNKGAQRTESNDKRIKHSEKIKRKEKELLNFYKFQIRDTKKQYIDELRTKFEQDKKRVAEMKSLRKFKPY